MRIAMYCCDGCMKATDSPVVANKTWWVIDKDDYSARKFTKKRADQEGVLHLCSQECALRVIQGHLVEVAAMPEKNTDNITNDGEKLLRYTLNPWFGLYRGQKRDDEEEEEEKEN